MKDIASVGLVLGFVLALGVNAVRLPLQLARRRSRPEELASSLVNAEDEWWEQAVSFADCNSTAERHACSNSSSEAFQRSCGIIVSAAVQGSHGVRALAREYLTSVCRVNTLTGWHRQRCFSLASFLNGATSENSSVDDKRYSEDVCQMYWPKFLSEQKPSITKARMERRLEKLFDMSRKMAEKKHDKAPEGSSQNNVTNDLKVTAVPQPNQKESVQQKSAEAQKDHPSANSTAPRSVRARVHLLLTQLRTRSAIPGVTMIGIFFVLFIGVHVGVQA